MALDVRTLRFMACCPQCGASHEMNMTLAHFQLLRDWRRAGYMVRENAPVTEGEDGFSQLCPNCGREARDE